jgi:hypothetical protein
MLWLVLIVFALVLPEILSTVLESRLGRAVAGQIERRGQGDEPGALGERIRGLEGEVDRLSEEVRRLTDESEFYQKLLLERASLGDPPLRPPGERTP